MKSGILGVMDDAYEYTIAEYIELEEHSNLKHEYVEGMIRLMGGGTLTHARIAGTIVSMLVRQLEGRPCAVYTSDGRIRVPGRSVITYPDISVGCGPVDLDVEDPYSQRNPTVLVEVTSPSSVRYDRGKKFGFYQGIPSLREYVVVSHTERAIDVYRRRDDGTWGLGERGEAGGSVRLESIDCVLEVDAVYRDPRALIS